MSTTTNCTKAWTRNLRPALSNSVRTCPKCCALRPATYSLARQLNTERHGRVFALEARRLALATESDAIDISSQFRDAGKWNQTFGSQLAHLLVPPTMRWGEASEAPLRSLLASPLGQVQHHPSPPTACLKRTLSVTFQASCPGVDSRVDEKREKDRLFLTSILFRKSGNTTETEADSCPLVNIGIFRRDEPEGKRGDHFQQHIASVERCRVSSFYQFLSKKHCRYATVRVQSPVMQHVDPQRRLTTGAPCASHWNAHTREN